MSRDQKHGDFFFFFFFLSFLLLVRWESVELDSILASCNHLVCKSPSEILRDQERNRERGRDREGKGEERERGQNK